MLGFRYFIFFIINFDFDICKGKLIVGVSIYTFGEKLKDSGIAAGLTVLLDFGVK